MSERPAARLQLRWHHVAPAVLALVLLGAWAAWRAHRSRSARAPEAAGAPAAEPAPEETPSPEAAAFPRLPVTLYWPRADGAGLVPRPAEIFATQRPTDRAKQVVELLARGPQAVPEPADPFRPPGALPAASGDEGAEGPPPGGAGTEARPAGEGLVAPLPAGTLVREAFIGADGTAYLSLSEQLVKDAPGGSSWELGAVYSMVNSLVRSLPEVQRVQLLIEGHDVETIGGHLDARRPFVFSESALAPERRRDRP